MQHIFSYVWEHMQYPVLVSYQPGDVTVLMAKVVLPPLAPLDRVWRQTELKFIMMLSAFAFRNVHKNHY